MNPTRWKALYFYYVLSLLIFTCYCTSCREKSSDGPSTPLITTKEQIPLDTAVALAKADSLYVLGEKFLLANKKDSSLYCYEGALALREEFLKEHVKLVESYYKVALGYIDQYKYDVADKYLEKARFSVEHLKVDPSLLVDLYIKSANCKMNMHDAAYSISLLYKAESIVKESFPKDSLLLYRIRHALASNYYYEHQYEKAINFLRQSLQLIPPHDDDRLAKSFTTLGIFYSAKGDQAKAIQFYNKAAYHAVRWVGPESDELAQVILQKSSALAALGQFDSARYYLKKNLDIRTRVYGNKDANTWGAKFTIALLEESSGFYDSAAKYYHEGLISLVHGFNNHHLQSNPRPTSTELNTDLIKGLVGKARALSKMMENSDHQHLDLSLNTFLLADSVFSVYRQNFLYDDAQLRQLESAYIPYHDMVAAAFQLYAKKKDVHYLEVALNTMERSRAVVLQNALRKAEAYGSTGVESTLKSKEKDLSRKQFELLHSLAVPDNSTALIDSLNLRLLVTNEELARLRLGLKKSNPNYFALQFDTPLLKIEKIQSYLKDQNSVVLEYIWSDSTIYLLAIGGDKIMTKVIPQSVEFRNALTDFTSALKINADEIIHLSHFKKFSQSSNTLYRHLIGDLLNEHGDEYAKLIISADGPLAIFPFEALTVGVDEWKEEVDYRLPYLIRHHPISYAYSMGILMDEADNKREGHKLLALGFAGQGRAMTKRAGLANLPGTEQEIMAIKEVMKNDVNKYFLESAASETMFKKQAADFDVVHLALHGVGDTLNAMESRLIFRLETDSLEDGQLFAHELYDLDLSKLDLVVLSACESGIGKQQKGEGLMSIARGFAYAGCPSLVISLWKIDDRTTAQVMKSFYSHLSNGEALDEALAKAKLDYLTNVNEHNSHPSYWAAFLQVGDARSLDIKKPNWVGWVWGVFILLLLTLVLGRGRISKIFFFIQPK